MKNVVALFTLVLLSASCSPPGGADLDTWRRDEALRQEIFARWMGAALRAEAEARELGTDRAGGVNDSLQSSGVYEIYDRHLAEVASEFGIPEVEVLAIQVEGLASGWPRPDQEP